LRPNWAAVSALATAVAAVVTLVAYLAPSAPPPPPQSDAIVTTRPAPPPPSPSPESSASQPPVPSPTRVVPGDSPPVSAVWPVRHGGCDEATTALTAYSRNAGTTRSSQAAAAHQTSFDLRGASLDAQGAVGATIRRLAAEFQELNFRLTGMTGGDPNQVIADINTDLAELERLCESG
jgi:hypothetical protein